MVKVLHRSTAQAQRQSHRQKRGVRREDAAFYVGVSPTQFDKWIADGTMPSPVRKGGIVLWDLIALDRALDQLFDTEADLSVWDDVHV